MDLSLARGLNYYTGAIFEVKALDYAIGSICGGGRYDNLTGIFGLPGMSGVGISFGADRIYDVLKGLDKFPKGLAGSATVLFANMDASVLPYIVPVVRTLREAGVSCEIYPDQTKLKKQFDYAEKKGIPFVSINGGDEAAAGKVNVKNLSTGEQMSFAKEDVDALCDVHLQVIFSDSYNCRSLGNLGAAVVRQYSYGKQEYFLGICCGYCRRCYLWPECRFSPSRFSRWEYQWIQCCPSDTCSQLRFSEPGFCSRGNPSK